MRATELRIIAIAIVLTQTLAACGKGSNSGTAGNTASAGAGGQTGTAAGSMASPPSGGDSTGTANAGGNAGAAVNMSDENIYSTLALLNGGEIGDAKAAERKGTSSAVKQFARTIITDHTKLQKRVDSLAVAKNVTPQAGGVADSLQKQHKAMADSLKNVSGRAYDSAYVASQVTAHQQTLTMLNQMAQSAKDTDLKATIQAAIPVIQGHLDKAKAIQQQLTKVS